MKKSVFDHPITTIGPPISKEAFEKMMEWSKEFNQSNTEDKMSTNCRPPEEIKFGDVKIKSTKDEYELSCNNDRYHIKLIIDKTNQTVTIKPASGRDNFGFVNGNYESLDKWLAITDMFKTAIEHAKFLMKPRNISLKDDMVDAMTMAFEARMKIMKDLLERTKADKDAKGTDKI